MWPQNDTFFAKIPSVPTLRQTICQQRDKQAKSTTLDKTLALAKQNHLHGQKTIK